MFKFHFKTVLFCSLLCLISCRLSAEEKPAYTIDCQFPGGNIIVDSIRGNDVVVHRDIRDTTGNWFYWAFRVRGAQGRKLTFKFSETDCVGARGPAVSLDGCVTWKWLGEAGFARNRFEYQFGPNDKEVVFACGMVYTQSTLERFLEANKDKLKIQKNVLCKSRKGRNVEMFRFGNPNNEHKLAILLTSRHHACEMMAAYAIEGIVEEIFSGSETGNWLLQNVDFVWIPFVDKDGVEDGDQGKYRKPHDHNNDYYDQIYPEIRAITKLATEWGKDKRVMYCDYHCPWLRDGINEIPYYPGQKSPYMDAQLKRFATLLEVRQKNGVIPYKESFNLPYGVDWNVGSGSPNPISISQWAACQKNTIFGAALEVPFANACGKSVTIETARELGHNLAKTYRDFLTEEIAHPTVNTPPVLKDPYAVPYNQEGKYLNISGVYPHLCAYNQPKGKQNDMQHGEAGIGALVPWAGKLWYLTYPQHAPSGSNDKLYSVDENLHMTVEKQSLGGTHANRMIHRESNQLFMGYYAIDAQGKIRTLDPNKLVGRLTANMRHLTDPANKIYYYDMEGAIYEADVKTLETKLLFKKPFPGWHGKGAYTGQDRVVFANNGGTVGQPTSPHLLVGGPQTGPEDAGILAQWDGKDKFEIVMQRQFTDVTGPGGIYGAHSMDDPIWAMGWDKRSVMLQLLENRQWHTFRIPKSSYTFDPKHGWFTEWPRIRETLPGLRLMCMHAGLFEFPKTFSLADTSGIKPIATHLRYIPDMCGWKDKIVLASDEASIQENPLCGQAQSNLWFGTLDEIRRFGPRTAWGGVWMNDEVQANEPSVPYLFNGYSCRTLHIKSAPGSRFEIQFDRNGKSQWEKAQTVAVGPDGYSAIAFDEKENACWIRLVPMQSGKASAFFQYLTTRDNRPDELKQFDSLADVSEKKFIGGVFRPASRNRSLQWLSKSDFNDPGKYMEIDIKSDATDLEFIPGDKAGARGMQLNYGRKGPCFSVDAASVVVVDANKRRWRLPKGPKEFDSLVLRDIREVESERYLAQMHGTFYEIPRWGIKAIPDFQRMKPVASHTKRIEDFCTWRGLLVLGGTKKSAPRDGHFFANSEGKGLWFGQIDDLWKMGRPIGEGGPLCDSNVKPGQPSDPYLMLGYDSKTIVFSHQSKEDVTFTIEIDFDLTGFSRYTSVTVPAGKKVEYRFPKGYQAHWLRIVADKPCKATAWCLWK